MANVECYLDQLLSLYYFKNVCLRFKVCTLERTKLVILIAIPQIVCCESCTTPPYVRIYRPYDESINTSVPGTISPLTSPVVCGGITLGTIRLLPFPSYAVVP